MENVVRLIVLLILFVWACVILYKKNRGFGYYILAFLFPFIGLIIAACLKKLDTEDEDTDDAYLNVDEDEE